MGLRPTVWNGYLVWACFFWLFVFPASLRAQHYEDLREEVRVRGYALRDTLEEDRYLATLDHLIRKSAMIIRGRVVAEDTRLSPSEWDVFTDYTIEVLEVFKDPQQLVGEGEKLVVTTLGGNLVVEERPVRAETPYFPPVPWIAPHLFYITRVTRAGAEYEFTGLGLGVLRLEKGRVVCDGPERNRHPATRPFCGTSQEEYIEMLKTRIAALGPDKGQP